MKFSLLSVLVAAVFLFGVAAAAAVVDVEVTTWDETSDDGPGRPPRRTLFSKKNPTAAAVAAPPPPPELLFLQAGTDCALTPSATSGEYLFRATVGTVTTYFSERPDRLAGTMTTEVFAEQFADNFFVTSNPNVAITFSGDDNNTGPLIVVLSRPRMVGSSSIIEYTMTQSSSQAKVASIDQFLETSSVSCSIFIDSDSVSNLCIPPVGTSTFGGVSKTTSSGYNDSFETCYQFGSAYTYCWTKSFYDPSSGLQEQCLPFGYTRKHGDGYKIYPGQWQAIDADYVITAGVDPKTNPKRCGDPCENQYQKFGMYTSRI